MKRKLLLILRHGKSDWTTGLEDFHRPLVGRGRKGARKMGTWIRHLDLVPDVVLSSPAARAKATTEAACKAMGLSLDRVLWDERLYEAPGTQVLSVLAAAPKKAKRVLLVGHNPGLEELIHLLVGEPPDIPEDGKLLPTAALARLEVAGNWHDAGSCCAHLLSVTRPGKIPDDESTWVKPQYQSALGPIPEHFFTQSAVIPYRIADGKPEVMLITSRKGTRWVLPKGVKEPELSLRDSASKEAFEEAGVRGEVDAEPIGYYEYAKWGGTCRVAVFPMAVSECLPDGEWEESHRERQWVSPQEAMDRLDEPELCKLVSSLTERLASA
ncbi:MAG: histidine phosphatase family protein [Azonexus sp.]